MVDCDVAYLAGLIDGEGWFLVNINPRGTQLRIGIRIGIEMKTGNALWVKRVEETLNKLGINYKKNNYNEGYTAIIIQRRDDIIKLSKILIPYLTVKLPHAKHFSERYPRLHRKSQHSGHGPFNRYLYWDHIYEWADFFAEARKLTSRKSESSIKWTHQAIIDFYQNLQDSHGYIPIKHGLSRKERKEMIKEYLESQENDIRK